MEKLYKINESQSNTQPSESLQNNITGMSVPFIL